MSSTARPRRVAVAFIVHSTSVKSAEPSFLIVSSRKHAGKAVLPKGGIESGETSAQAALRESHEEAGVDTDAVVHLSHLLNLPDSKPHKLSPSQDPTSSDFLTSTLYDFELFSCPDKEKALTGQWLESEERTREWVTGWNALSERICWGRREQAMKQAIVAAKHRLGYQ